jgi:hypothetical protein
MENGLASTIENENIGMAGLKMKKESKLLFFFKKTNF